MQIRIQIPCNIHLTSGFILAHETIVFKADHFKNLDLQFGMQYLNSIAKRSQCYQSNFNLSTYKDKGGLGGVALEKMFLKIKNKRDQFVRLTLWCPYIIICKTDVRAHRHPSTPICFQNNTKKTGIVPIHVLLEYLTQAYFPELTQGLQYHMPFF